MKFMFSGTVLILFLFLSNFAIAAEIPITSQRTLRQRLEIYIELLDKESLKASKDRDRISALKRITGQINNVIQMTENPTRQDKEFSEALVAGLSALPTRTTFKQSSCDSYVDELSQVAKQWSGGHGSNEALKAAQSFLNLLCN